jgi:hypothetical protein
MAFCGDRRNLFPMNQSLKVEFTRGNSVFDLREYRLLLDGKWHINVVSLLTKPRCPGAIIPDRSRKGPPI